MTVEQLIQMINSKQTDALEAAWTQAVEEDLSLADLGKALETLVKTDRLNLAETLGQALLTQRTEQLAGPDKAKELLEVAKAVVSGVAASDELRAQAGNIYHQAYPDHPHFDAILKASGLLSGQSPRRALRTLDVCLAIQAESYLANRYDHSVIRLRQYSPALGEFQATNERGGSIHMEPKKLADEYELVDEHDFRVLRQHRPEDLAQLVADDPAAVLIGVCLSSSGQVDSNTLKDMLVPAYIPKESWSGWWSRARTAAKRSPQLTLEGRSPIVVQYHPAGQTLEQELAYAVVKAMMPLQRLEIMQQYVRESRGRKLTLQESFAAPIVESLAEMARLFAGKQRHTDALAASLGIESAKAMGLQGPKTEYPSAAQIVASDPKPAQSVAELGEPSLWPIALDAIMTRPDAPEQLEKLLHLAPTGQIDEVASRLNALGRPEIVTAAVAEAVANPVHELSLALWLWKGPAQPSANMPGKVELLNRVLTALHELDHDWEADPAMVKQVRQRIRAALSASDFACYKAAVALMDEAVAGTIKRMIDRTEGLAEAVQDEMLNVLRENFYSLFVRARVEPWLDENALWTTDAAMRRREDELKYLVDIKMFENAKAIGAAAEHGDLSENSEWKFALEERDLLRARAAKMQEELAKARIIEPEAVPTKSVGIGSRVHVARVSDSQPADLKFLGPWDSDLENQVFSYQTVLGLSLMGHKVGDVLTLKIGGEEGEYRIDAIGSAMENK